MSDAFADAQVQAAWTRVWNKCLAFMQKVQTLDEAQLSLAPPKGFNSVETIRHLCLTDKFELDLIKRTPLGYARNPRMNFIGRMVLSGMKKARPMPTMAAMTPAPSMVTQEAALSACREWTFSLEEIKQFSLSKSSQQTLLKHPLFGPMGPLDLFALMEVHLDYHVMRLAQAGLKLESG